MSLIIDLDTFLLEGSFGPIKLRYSFSEVVNILGPEDGETEYDNGEFSYWNRDYEFFFDRDLKLVGIQNDHLLHFKTVEKSLESIFFKNEYFSICSAIIGKESLDYDSIINVLNKMDIKVWEIHEKHGYGSRRIKFNSGAYLSFDDEEKNLFGSPLLEGIRFYSKEHFGMGL